MSLLEPNNKFYLIFNLNLPPEGDVRAEQFALYLN